MLQRMCALCLFALIVPGAVSAEGIRLDEQVIRSFSGPSGWKVHVGMIDPVDAAGSEVTDYPCTGSEWKDGAEASSMRGVNDVFATFCRVIEVDATPVAPVAIDLGAVGNADRTFLNGLMIGSTGNLNNPDAQVYDRRRVYTVDSSLFHRGRNVLIVHARRYFAGWSAPAEIAIGPSSLVEGRIHGENYRRSFLLAAYAVTACYFLFLFLNRRQEKQNLYFALLVFSLVVYQFLKTQLKYDFFDSLTALKKTEYIVLTTLGPFLYLFVRSYFPLPEGRTGKIARILGTAGISFAVLVAGVFLVTSEPITWSLINKRLHLPIIVPLLCMLAIYHLIHHARRRNRDAILLSSGIGIIIVSTVVDVLTTYNVWNLPFVTGYTFFIFVLNIAVILSRRFVRLHAEVEDLNENLEQKVEERTDELNYSLKQLQVLKEKQDGDYFFTSLLIHPLAGTEIEEGPVSLRSLTKQKKTFQFRGKDYEIGGDISIGDRIELRNRSFTAFINADAMGKSIQGAGGALVIGTVFRAILGRTRGADVFRQRSPEQWMKEAYREMQDVFCSFDGSMLVSAFFGLLDESSGTLYYINAEHPRSVLYRSGRATFFEDGGMFYKFGIDTFQPKFRVGLFRLRPGDALILGTDGRDDLILKSEDSLSINDDMDLFLSHVENSEADLQLVFQSLLERGLLTDDLSLLRVGYRELEPSIPFDSGARERALGSVRSGDWAAALVSLEEASELDPSDTEILYWISVARRKLAAKKSDVALAIDAGERVRMREPDHIDNLRNLLKCYEAVKDPKMFKLRSELGKALRD